MAAWFLSLSAALGNIYFLPTFTKRISGFPDRAVTSLLLLPAIVGIAGILINAWHSDKTGERRWHCAIPLLASGAIYELLLVSGHNVPVILLVLLLGSGLFYAFYPVFWAIPTMILSESAAAATYGLYQFCGTTGWTCRSLSDRLSQRTHARTHGEFRFDRALVLAAGALTLSLRINSPLEAVRRSVD